jgi:hypothetical protein
LLEQFQAMFTGGSRQYMVTGSGEEKAPHP